MKSKTLVPILISLISGGALWTATAVYGGKIEPWDCPAYWSVAYPVAVVWSGVLGGLFPRGAWRWALLVMFSQAPVMAMRGAGYGLFVLGTVLIGVLAVPAVLMAFGGSWVRGKVGAGEG